MEIDKISDFSSFLEFIEKHFSKDHLIKNVENDVYISKIDPIGRSIIYFMHFKQVESPFGFLYLDTVEKNGTSYSIKYSVKSGCSL